MDLSNIGATMTEEPHPLRCETCVNHECPFGDDAKYLIKIIPNIMRRVGCASHSSANTRDQQEHDQKIREEVMDKFGILHGEDARRFNEYMENEDKQVDTPEGRKLIKEAHEWANKTLHIKDNTSDKGLLTDEEFTHIIHSLETRPGSCWLCRSIKRKIKELRQERE